ncbi:hypothetical protein J2W42_003239 [Rhizobium tibeticum]|uniref:hypothetical protein n=1 Tax=Rhizobium tibeticum TaxID=501024 RepID=UPI0027836339|nr:hypothetical protein [Rhizobium tibeticum]MDP9810378.1 hypothetical protein [Rhizobium tibeticum]
MSNHQDGERTNMGSRSAHRCLHVHAVEIDLPPTGPVQVNGFGGIIGEGKAEGRACLSQRGEFALMIMADPNSTRSSDDGAAVSINAMQVQKRVN